MTDEEIKLNWYAIAESGASMTAIHNLREHYKTIEKENFELKHQLEEMTKDRDGWKQRAIDTYGDF